MFVHWKNQGCQNDYIPKAIYRCNAIPLKLLMAFFIELEEKISKFVWRYKRPWIAKVTLTSDYTKKLQSSKQYGAGIKTEILIDGKG